MLYPDADAAEQIRRIAPDGVDQVVEVAVSANDVLNRAVIKVGGTIASYANDRGEAFTLDVWGSMGLNLRYQFVLLYTIPRPAIEQAAADINQAIRDGALPIGEESGLPLHRFPLEQTPDAHSAVQNDAVGKVLIQVGAATE